MGTDQRSEGTTCAEATVIPKNFSIHVEVKDATGLAARRRWSGYQQKKRPVNDLRNIRAGENYLARGQPIWVGDEEAVRPIHGIHRHIGKV